MTTGRCAALYDIHGNLPALDAVLEDVRRAAVTQVVVGGDVFPGPMANEALARLLALDMPVTFLHGNGDREILTLAAGLEPTGVPAQYRATMRWQAERLEPEHRRLMALWPASVRMRIDALGDVLFCHATPRNDTDIFTRETPDHRVAPVFNAVGAHVVVCGHTHMQFDRTIGGVRIVNAGSVGMAFGDAAACWALVGPDVELRRTLYDLEAAAARLRTAEYPDADQFVDRYLLQRPSEQAMLEAYARSEFK